MPIACIGLAVLFLPMIFYKNFIPFHIPKLMFGAILFLLLCGYFIAPIDIAGKFNFNVLFSFGVLVLCLQLWFSVPVKTKIMILLATLVSTAVYVVLTYFDTDAISFLSYWPAMLIACVAGVLFVPNMQASCAASLGTLLFVEWSNYYSFHNNIGYLSICSVDFMQAAFWVCTILVGLNLLYSGIKKWITTKRRIV